MSAHEAALRESLVALLSLVRRNAPELSGKVIGMAEAALASTATAAPDETQAAEPTGLIVETFNQGLMGWSVDASPSIEGQTPKEVKKLAAAKAAKTRTYKLAKKGPR